MEENSDGNDTNVGSIGNSIEEDITKINTYIELVLEKDYCNCNELNTILGKHCDGSKNVAYAMQHILSDYKRVLKENEIYKKNSEIMSKENLSTAEQLKVEIKENFRLKNQLENNRKEYQETYKDVREELKELKKENEILKKEKEQAWEEWNNLEQGSYETEQKLKQQIKELRKENEELKKDYYNVINKIENKIDILDIAISECIYIDDDDKAYKKAVKKDKLCLLNQKRALQELLEGGQS